MNAQPGDAILVDGGEYREAVNVSGLIGLVVSDPGNKQVITRWRAGYNRLRVASDNVVEFFEHVWVKDNKNVGVKLYDFDGDSKVDCDYVVVLYNGYGRVMQCHGRLFSS